MNHIAANCWYKYERGYTPNHNNRREPIGAYVVSESSNQNAWYLDSEATNHVTNNLRNLSINSEFKGDDRLTVGNGEKLKISHICCSLLNTLDTQTVKHIKLNQMLHVPKITKNLKSVSKLLSDNEVEIKFDKSFCLIKNKNIDKEQEQRKSSYERVDKEGVY